MTINYKTVLKACIRVLERARRPEVLTTKRDCSWSLSHNKNAERMNRDTAQNWMTVRSALVDVLYCIDATQENDEVEGHLQELYKVLGPFHGEEKPNGG